MANIVTDYGAVPDGGYTITPVTIGSGSANLSATISVWSSGDTGKPISVGGAGVGTPPFQLPLLTTITSVGSSGFSVGLGAVAINGLASESRGVVWGTNNSSMFAAFTTAEIGNTVSLTLPSGVYHIQQRDVLFEGISNLTIEGSGVATLAMGIVGSIGCGRGQFQDSAHSARVQSVNTGSTFVTLMTSTEISLFAAGRIVMMSGIDLQGNGFPTNPGFFEYLQVASASTANGTVSFTTPTEEGYLSTWPVYSTGGAFAPDHGGPATLYALSSTFNSALTYNGVTFIEDLPTGCVGRTVTFNNCTFTGVPGVQNSGPFPSQNETYTMNGCSLPNCSMEADKLVEQIVFSNSTIPIIVFQSGTSIKELLVSNGSSVGFILGTPKRTILRDSTISSLRPGSLFYGKSDSLVATNCEITTTDSPGFAVVDQGDGSAGLNNSPGVSMVSGTIIFPNNYKGVGPIPWAIPGTLMMWSDPNGWKETTFRITGLTQDASHTYVHTNHDGGFLPVPFSPPVAEQVWVYVHACPDITIRNCTGTRRFTCLNDAPGGRPWGSYVIQVFTSGAITNVEQTPGFTWGSLMRLSMNVTHPYTGGGALSFTPGTNFPIILDNNEAFQFYNPVIDMKTGGERIIRASGVTGGPVGADSGLSVPSPFSWFVGGPVSQGPIFSADVSATDPNVSVILIWELDQEPFDSPPSSGTSIGVFFGMGPIITVR